MDDNKKVGGGGRRLMFAGILFGIIVISLAAILFAFGPCYRVRVHVVDFSTKYPAADVRYGVFQENRRITAKTSDREGNLTFYLPAGFYKLRPVSGHTGSYEIQITGDSDLTLEVLGIIN